MSCYSKEFILLLNHLVLCQDIFSLVLISIQCQCVCLFVYWFSFVSPFNSTCPFYVTSRSVSQPFVLVGHILSLFPCFLLFVCIVVVSQSIRHTVHKFIRQIVKPSVCLSIFLFVFAILLVCLLAIHLVCKILVTLY